jgi:hypothetical protein
MEFFRNALLAGFRELLLRFVMTMAAQIWEIPKNFSVDFPGFVSEEGPANPKPKFDSEKFVKACSDRMPY